MHFIGIFGNHIEFESIKQNVMNLIQRKDLDFIHITSKNIENMRNIIFETIILCNKCNINDIQKDILNKICGNCKYIVMNADIFSNTKILSNKMSNCITYGLNQKSTITVSSIQEEKAIISIQRNIKNIEENEIEMGEASIELNKNRQINIENILAIYSVLLLYK